tara:strand:+ start:45 stop:1568 length:1524 start_codon:yes stop_codon:yes gene_type:complete
MPSHYHSWSTDFADKVEETGRKGVEKLKEWSKEDDTTWTDDALRAGGSALKIVGHAANLPVAKQALQILGAGGWAGGKVGGKIAESLKIDPRLGRWTGGAIGDAVSGGLIAKGAKISKTALQIRKLNKSGAGLEAFHAVQLGKNKGFAFASGPKNALKTQATMSDALTINKKGRKLLDKIEKHVDYKAQPLSKKLQMTDDMLIDKPITYKGKKYKTLQSKLPDDKDALNWKTSRIDTSDFDKLDATTKKTVIRRNKDIGKYESKIQDFNKRLSELDANWKNDPYYMRTKGIHAGIPRDKSKIRDMIIGKRKDNFRRIQDMKARSLEETVDKFTSSKTPGKGFERHHIAGLKWAEPFFEGLNATEANELRKFAAKHNVYFGNDLKNKIDLHYKIHQSGGRNIKGEALDIHLWLNDVGFNQTNLNLKGANLTTKKAAMAKLVDQVFREKMKLVDLQLMDIKDLKSTMTPAQWKKYQKNVKIAGKPEDMLTINTAKAQMQQDIRKQLKIK